MKTPIFLLMFFLAGAVSAAPARERTAKQIKGKSYAADIEVLEQSQALALEMGQAALEKIEGADDRKKMARAVDLIGEAKTLLASARKDRGQLDEVIRKQEQAFQILLELASKEHRIMRSQQQSQSSASAQQRQEMNDLELKMKENKYQDRRLANPEQEQNQEQQEQLQVLSRLRELARRQNDINERLKQLQTQLQAAEDEQEKEELRRQLKRLLEEQKRMLEDMDELNQRMQREENESRMADSRRELQQARDAAQKTAEAMERERVSQAAAAGTRAEETLKEMQDEFRKKTAGRFAEDMRKMREEARDLSQRQKELNRELDGKDEARQKSLASEGKGEQLARELREQNQRLTELMRHAEQVSRQSEIAEPVLHRQLYDSLRTQAQREAKNIAETSDELQRRRVVTTSIYRLLQEAGDPNQPKSLDIAAELADMGFKQPALPIGERTKEALEEFQREIEQAAESVLGDESEALARARREVEELARMLGGELDRARSQQIQTNRLAMAGAGKPEPSPGQGRESKDGQQRGQEGEGSQSSGEQGEGPGQRARTGQRGEGGRDGQSERSGEQGRDGKSGQRGQAGESGQPGQGGQGQSPNGKNGEGEPRDNEQNSSETGQGQGQGEGQGQGRGQPGGEGQGGQNPAAGERRMARGERNGQGQPGQGGGGRGGDQQQPRPQPGMDRSVDGRNGGWGNILPGEAGQIGERDGNNAGPITGESYAEWADRMRNVEEMVSSDEMRNRLAAVRERVRAMRVEHKRHSKEPEWALLRDTAMKPLVEIRDQIANELARLNSREAIVPIDRDPVPDRFADLVRRYYETLGSDAKN